MELNDEILALFKKLDETNKEPSVASLLAELKQHLQQEANIAATEPLWRKLFGPGKRELELSQQRQALIDRCERAEASAFDALAETAEVGRERDSALAELKRIQAEKSD